MPTRVYAYYLFILILILPKISFQQEAYPNLNSDTTLDYLNNELKKISNENEISRADILIQIGYYYAGHGDYDQSTKNLEKALEIYIKNNDTTGIATFHEIMAGLYQDSGNFKKSLTELLIAKELYIQQKDSIKLVHNNSNIAIIYSHLEKKKEALQIHHEIIKSTEDPYFLSVTYNSLGFLYSNLNKFNKNYIDSIFDNTTVNLEKGFLLDSALYYQQLALTFFKEDNALEDIGYAYLGIASIYRQQRRYKEAISSYSSAYDIALKTDLTDLLNQSSLKISESYDSINNIDSAHFWLKKYYSNTKVGVTEKTIAHLSTHHQQLLIKQNEKIIQEKERLKNKLTISLFLGTIILLLAIIIILFYRNQLKTQRDFLKGTLKGAESERKKLSMELHDDIGQRLTLIKNLIDEANIPKISKKMHEGISALRKVSRSMYPSSLSSIGFVGAIEDLIETTEKNSQIEFTYEIDENIDQLLNEDQKLNLFRIIQECINNTLKHANATAIRITTEYSSNNKLILKYFDNGVGISQKSIKNGAGIYNINERIKMMNSTWKITSPSKGVLLIFYINF